MERVRLEKPAFSDVCTYIGPLDIGQPEVKKSIDDFVFRLEQPELDDKAGRYPFDAIEIPRNLFFCCRESLPQAKVFRRSHT
jgi:hypothetical protein